jgi:putative FmdB family regulatory protein
MPTYDYHCETCGKEFEHFQSMSAPKLTTCLEETCVGSAAGFAKGKGVVVRKISGGAGLVFNGDGFYVTDYVKKESASSSKSSTKAGATSGSAAESGSNSNVASSTDSSPSAPSSSAPTA